MNVFNRDTVAVTDLGAYRDNLKKIQAFIGPAVRLMGVVKGNAYGHGMVECARTALDAGAGLLGVAYACEGIQLRESGIEAPVLVLAAEDPGRIGDLIDHDLTIGLSSFETLLELKRCLHRKRARCSIHLKVDTGMGRVGVRPNEAERLLRSALDTSGIAVEGIFSHFPCSDEERDGYTRDQIDIFRALLEDLTAKGLRPPVAHLCNSAGILKFPEAHLDMVRPGIMSFGLPACPGGSEILPLRPVLSWKSRVALVKDVPAGFPVSYGGTYVTKRPSRLATVPVGYADGYRRFLSNRGRAVIRGTLVPIAGRVCMDQTVFDVTDAGEVRPGDPVTLVGEDGGVRITVEDLANLGETITHEIVTGISGRVSRSVIPAS